MRRARRPDAQLRSPHSLNPMRIAAAGFQHETNTFGVTKATFRDFEIADSWPGLLRDDQVVSGTHGINLPIAGFCDAALAACDIDLVPVLWASAEPSAHVTDDAFDRIAAMVIDGLPDRLDGLYLDLHGAMVTESYDDGEGELLRRIRAVVGPDLPIALSLDLHANVTARMVKLATSICIFRTYPHLDMAATGARCVPMLRDQIAGSIPTKAFRQGPFVIPLNAQYTGTDPCKALYAAINTVVLPGESADIALGFTAADIADMGPSVVAYAPSQARADDVADALLAKMIDKEHDFDVRLLTPSQAVQAAMASTSDQPVIIADVQDNAGAGATSDTTGMLKALIAGKAQGALLGLLADPEVAAQAHQAGKGARISSALGGKSGLADDSPVQAVFLVETLSDGQCAFTGQMYGGGIAVLGPSAVLRVDAPGTDIRVVVTSTRSQCLDLGLFTHFGLNPAQARIVVVKSTVHFRADFEPIAAQVLNAAAPGVFPCDLTKNDYRNLRPGLRVGPGGPVFGGTPV